MSTSSAIIGLSPRSRFLQHSQRASTLVWHAGHNKRPTKGDNTHLTAFGMATPWSEASWLSLSFRILRGSSSRRQEAGFAFSKGCNKCEANTEQLTLEYPETPRQRATQSCWCRGLALCKEKAAQSSYLGAALPGE
jgi:hypothetical protein